MGLFALCLALVIVALGAVTSVHITVLALASLLYRQPPRPDRGTAKLLVMIPARNEERVLDAALVSVARQLRGDDILTVVADRCTDRTAEIARARGARVLERGPGSPPGRAAAVRDGLAWTQDGDWDAVVFLDADCTLQGGFLDCCRAAVSAGIRAAQARVDTAPTDRLQGLAYMVATGLRAVTLARGKDRLGGWVRLNGSGMVLARKVAEGYQFDAEGASEDAQYSLGLCLAGVHARHLDDARLWDQAAPTVRAGSRQHRRIEAGRLYAARRYLGPLLRARTRASLEAAVHLGSPPVAVAVLLLAIGGGLAAWAGWPALGKAAAVLLALLLVDVVIALCQLRAAPRVWLALTLAPAYVLWKGWIQLRALLAVRSADEAYEPTPRG